MIETLPAYINWLFGLTTVLAVYLFYRATGNSKTTLWIIVAWLILQAFISLTGFYTETDTRPPRFLLLILPPLLLIIVLFVTPKGKRFIDNMDPARLTYLHTIRIPIEVVLFLLIMHKFVPQLMTFEGRNFDLLTGLTAPLVGHFGFTRQKLGKWFLLAWNFICLGLLINIAITALLSAPFPFQQFAYDQPNVAVLYFPYIWLPCGIVPIVLLSHLAVIRQLLRKPGEAS